MAHTIAAQTASAIRKELKQHWPRTKFRVRSDNFAGGNAVRIEWMDGPTARMVQKITGKYEYGHFDGMFDIYEYTNVRDDIPQVKYVTEQRSMSEKTRMELTRYGSTHYELWRDFSDLDLSDDPTTDEQWAYLTRY